MKVNRLKQDEADYPKVLRTIASPPKELFWAGEPIKKWITRPKVSVVGSRKATSYGHTVTTELATQLARAGVVIISGLALGIDSIAHKAALDAGGTTVAVLPGPIERIYPASHANLARLISGSGTLLSEYPPGAEIYKTNFIARNRLISGLADVLLITEAALTSGSLHTAAFALEQGRTVMAVPGSITGFSSVGANNLIKSGAIPVTEVDDIFFALGMNHQTKPEAIAFRGTAQEEAVLKSIKSGTRAQEEIALSLKLDAASLAFILTYLEINGYIKPAGGGNWLAN